jgi:glycosyltransferase involved in cell wall biosynthesis
MTNQNSATSEGSPQPLVSIIMNCFNGEKYLKEAVDSVRAQNYKTWEVIFWDNQSTDGSAEILKSYADPRLKYFYAPKHTRLYEARNCALEKASGEFFAFLDVDDWWCPEKLEKQVPLFNDPEVGLVCGNYWVVNEHKKKQWEQHKQLAPTGRILNDLLKDYFVGLLTLIVRRSALDSLSYPCDPRYHIIGDFDLVVRLAVDWKLDCVHEPVAFYRQHSGSESYKHRARQVDELAGWLREMSEVESIRSCSSWDVVNNNFIYHNAINQILLGNKKSVYRLSKELQWGKPKLKLLFSLLLPTYYIQQRFRH